MMGGQPAEPLRIGVLGAARIAALAIAGPAHTTGEPISATAPRCPSTPTTPWPPWS